MVRRQSFLSALARSVRDAERQQIQLARAQARTELAWQRAEIAEQKLRVKLYADSKVEEVELKNEELEDYIEQLNSLLTDTLRVDDFFDLERLKPQFNPGLLAVEEKAPRLEDFLSLKPWSREAPKLERFLPNSLAFFERIIPGAKERYSKKVEQAKRNLEAALEEYKRIAGRHKRSFEAALEEYKRREEERLSELHRTKAEHEKQVAELEQFQTDLKAGTPEAIVNYVTLVLEASSYPAAFPKHAKLAYVPESKQLVVEYDFPTFDVVPSVREYRYVKASDEIRESPRPMNERRSLYSSLVAQVTLRTLHELFEADRLNHLETIVYNGHVDSIDKGTGQPVRPCLVTLRTTKSHFEQIDLSKVDPPACLRALNASVSKSPAELAPVRPVLEFNMVDPRFIEETDVLSDLDQRPNLMELTPNEFESLITNLFEKMGLETRLTQASRDGGIDCVAYDPRPVLGGKVVIQAKRYKNTVGVSAVRDLFGAVHNEGTSKGILVTTSGYGKAAFEFAEGKPLELLSGTHLLYLLKEHAGIEAKIEVPEDWKDPEPDSEN